MGRPPDAEAVTPPQRVKRVLVSIATSLAFHAAVFVILANIYFLVVRDRQRRFIVQTDAEMVAGLNPLRDDLEVGDPTGRERESALSDLDQAARDLLREVQPSPSASGQDTTIALLRLGDESFSVIGVGARMGDPSGFGTGGEGVDRIAGKAFGQYVRGLRASGLDVVFVFDSTGSMGPVIVQVTARIEELMEVVHFLVPGARIGLVTYRDRDPQDEYVVRRLPLTNRVDDLKAFLRGVKAYGGGDAPEAVDAGLDEAVNRMPWEPRARKIIILFGDQPPHPENTATAYRVVEAFHRQRQGVINTIDTFNSIEANRFTASPAAQVFATIAQKGGGAAFKLTERRQIIEQLVVLAFGAEYRDQVNKVYQHVLAKRGGADPAPEEPDRGGLPPTLRDLFAPREEPTPQEPTRPQPTTPPPQPTSHPGLGQAELDHLLEGLDQGHRDTP